MIVNVLKSCPVSVLFLCCNCGKEFQVTGGDLEVIEFREGKSALQAPVCGDCVQTLELQNGWGYLGDVDFVITPEGLMVHLRALELEGS